MAVPSRPDRQREVIDAARRVVVREGLGSTTLRKIAREAGFTTGVVSHYFPDKKAVIVSCFEAVSANFMGQVAERLAHAGSLEERVAVLVEAAVPAEADLREEWRLWSEMWNYAAGAPDFRRVVVETDAAWERIIRGVLVEAQRTGRLRSSVDPAREAAVVARLVDGLGIRAWLSGDWEEARRLFVHHLSTLGLPVPT